jgi:phosphoribosyl 1,2-cyclic phosphodiesterase
MKIKTIASGSKGNCTIVCCNDTNLIIDMGITFLTLQKCLEENSLSFNDFSGILITHCHNDHIKGLSTLMKKTQLKAYIPKEMYESMKEYIPYPKCIFIEDNFQINDVEIELIHTSHDAPASVGYIIKQDDKSLVYVTDTGYINRKFLERMKNHDLYLIESNHDEIMLMDGPYPRFLKERVISDRGHLSNHTTAGYLKKIIGPKTKNIILAHLSETNNTKEKALEAIKEVELPENIKIHIADQYVEGPIIEV